MYSEKVVFRLKPEYVGTANGVALLGDFNNWDLKKAIYLHPQFDGSWATEVELPTGEYQYKFLLSNGKWVTDDAHKVSSDLHPGLKNSYLHIAKKETHSPEPFVLEEDKRALEVMPSQDQPLREQKETEKKSGSAATQFQKQFHDLTQLPGITKEVEELLYQNNLRTYGAMGKTSVKKLKEILKSGGKNFEKYNPETWTKLGKLASLGKWEDVARHAKKS